jgi:hypothetical protein
MGCVSLIAASGLKGLSTPPMEVVARAGKALPVGLLAAQVEDLVRLAQAAQLHPAVAAASVDEAAVAHSVAARYDAVLAARDEVIAGLKRDLAAAQAVSDKCVQMLKGAKVKAPREASGNPVALLAAFITQQGSAGYIPPAEPQQVQALRQELDRVHSDYAGCFTLLGLNVTGAETPVALSRRLEDFVQSSREQVHRWRGMTEECSAALQTREAQHARELAALRQELDLCLAHMRKSGIDAPAGLQHAEGLAAPSINGSNGSSNGGGGGNNGGKTPRANSGAGAATPRGGLASALGDSELPRPPVTQPLSAADSAALADFQQCRSIVASILGSGNGPLYVDLQHLIGLLGNAPNDSSSAQGQRQQEFDMVSAELDRAVEGSAFFGEKVPLLTKASTVGKMLRESRGEIGALNTEIEAMKRYRAEYQDCIDYLNATFSGPLSANMGHGQNGLLKQLMILSEEYSNNVDAYLIIHDRYKALEAALNERTEERDQLVGQLMTMGSSSQASGQPAAFPQGTASLAELVDVSKQLHETRVELNKLADE